MRRIVGVAGLGLMGQGIATCLLNHGFPVIALETSDAVRQRVAVRDGLKIATAPCDLAPCEFVIESISEDLALKAALFRELEPHLGEDVPLVSNTSAIPITLLQSPLKHPGRFAGMHWTSPAESTRFLEIIRGDHTHDETLARVEALAYELDKQPGIVQRDLPGFAANRMAYALFREAIYLLEEGVASVETIDALCQHSIGHWASFCGPFRWMDITGGPTLYATAMERIVPTLNNCAEVQPLMRQMQTADAQGTKNGRGFYPYEARDGQQWRDKLHKHAVEIQEVNRKADQP